VGDVANDEVGVGNAVNDEDVVANVANAEDVVAETGTTVPRMMAAMRQTTTHDRAG
jgi:hypothetical protein